MIEIDGKWAITREDIDLENNEPQADFDENGMLEVSACLKTWFDVDARLGSDTGETGGYVNLYVAFIPSTGHMRMFYYQHDDDRYSGERETYLLDSEKAMFLTLLRESGMDRLIKEAGKDKTNG